MSTSNAFIISASWIITAEPTVKSPFGEILSDHAIVIENEKIADIIPQQDISAKYPTLPVLDKTGHALLPGWVNTHTHVAMNLLRGYADDLPLMTWLQEHIWPAEGAHVAYDFVADGTELAIAEMLKGGTTCFNDMYMFPDAVADTANRLGVRAAIGLIVIDFPTAWAQNADEYFEKAVALQQLYSSNPLITTVMAPHSPYTVCDENLTRAKAMADEFDLNLHIHLHETAQEVSDSVEQYGVRPIQRLYELGLINDRLIAVHMTQLEDSEIALLSQKNVSIVHCPESNLKLASGIARTNDLLKANINVAVGTDGAASNNDLSMLGELRTAALLAKGSAQDATAVSAMQAIQIGTLNGAKALGLGEQIGSIAIGKQADLQCINLNAINTAPNYEPASTIVHSANDSQVSDVWINGQQQLENGKLTDINESELIAKAQAWQTKIRA